MGAAGQNAEELLRCIRSLEHLERAHRARQVFFTLSAVCFVAAVGVAVFAALRIQELAPAAGPATAVGRYLVPLVAAGALDVASLAFLIFGLQSRADV